MFTPSYARLHEQGLLSDRAATALEQLRECRLCPRACGVDRTRGGSGFCRTGRHAKAASFGAHFGEEAPLVGSHGSGTIFFSSCNLLCTFCQNSDISHGAEGVEVGPREIAGMMLDLAGRGCHNINFVTPSHVVPQILEALVIAADAGLDLPLVYNTGGYDAVETLRLLEGVFDIYMPDFKFWDPEPAQAFCRAPDYRDAACNAILEMHRQVGDLVMDDRGIARSGLLVRHLVMPGGLAGTQDVMRFLAEQVSRHTYVNVMDQYHPCHRAGKDPRIDRRITAVEYEDALDAARRAGIHRLDDRKRITVRML
ncbi:MAG TPA: radical SAM protein [Deltaproteobacteria bacterium]|nr:radical SAM protein [Deltaproteobacteria bacterium]HQI80151.1 radical SAM protein [Deltaproteobacteria bacterium]